MAEDYVSSMIMVDIPEFSEKYIDGKTITFYLVNVYDNFSRQKWVLEKRYSEFESLHRNLAALLPNIPPIPGKSIFKVSSYDALTKRRIQLEQFLKDSANRKDICATDFFKQFLELEKHSPELNYNQPEKISENTELPLGIRDFYYYREESMVFVVCCDMNIASRVDAYITNVNLPWEKKTDAHISVGAVFAFFLGKTKSGQYVFEKKWAKSFPEQTGVVNWDAENCIVQVGLDSGRIVLFKTSADSRFIQYDELLQIRPHKDRVMGVAIDSSKGLIYSCSTDKKFYITELNTANSIEIAESTSGYTNLYLDKKNERIFLTNESGMVSVFLTNSIQPTIINIIQTHSTNAIRGFHIDLSKLYIFTATNKGDISVLDLGLPGKEKLIKELTYFGGNIEIRIIRYNPNRNEIITGDQNGKITVWSLRTGQPVFAWQAHSGAITQMYFDPNTRILFTGGKDRSLQFWQLPEKWVNDEVERFEKDEMKNINDTKAMLRIQKTLIKNEDDEDSSDDSLNGWDLRP